MPNPNPDYLLSPESNPDNIQHLLDLAKKHPRASFTMRANRLIRESGNNKGEVFGIAGASVERYHALAPDGDKRRFAELLGVSRGLGKPNSNRFDAALFAAASEIEAKQNAANAPVKSEVAPAALVESPKK